GGAVLVQVGALVLDAEDLLKGAAGAGGGVAAEHGDLGVIAAQLGPVGDLAGEDLGYLLAGQLGHGVLGVHDDGYAVLGDDVRNSAFAQLVLGELTAGEAQVTAARQDTL